MDVSHRSCSVSVVGPTGVRHSVDVVETASFPDGYAHAFRLTMLTSVDVGAEFFRVLSYVG
jgi:hypothetical protein